MHDLLRTGGHPDLQAELFDDAIARVLRPETPPEIAGAALAISHISGRIADGVLADALTGQFLGAMPETAERIAMLRGILHTDPALIWQAEGLLPAINQFLGDLDEAEFLTLLPHLRLAFTALNPRETDRLSGMVAAMLGVGAETVSPLSTQVSEADLGPGPEGRGDAGREHGRRWAGGLDSGGPGAMSEGTAHRWRLALGRYAEGRLGGLGGAAGEMDKTLDYLYAREYDGRGITRDKGPGSLDPTQMNALKWLGQARKLFPHDVFETLQGHALDRYGLTDLLKDRKTLDDLEPNQDLLKVLLSFDGRADPAVKDKLREVARRIIDDIVRRLKPQVMRAFSGSRNRFRRSNIKAAANFDWRATIRENLASYDPETGRIIAERLRFISREKRRLPWTVILCVDQSGSMTDSLLYSAVMAAILSGLPGVRVRMVLFDTSVLDVSDRLSDPLETLLSVQLGGGTDIGKAVSYCETLVDDPDRTVFALISDFGEGAPPRRLYAALARMAEARVRMLGLLALDDGGMPAYDEAIARRAAELGMHVGAMSPDRFADWLAEVMT